MLVYAYARASAVLLFVGFLAMACSSTLTVDGTAAPVPDVPDASTADTSDAGPSAEAAAPDAAVDADEHVEGGAIPASCTTPKDLSWSENACGPSCTASVSCAGHVYR